MERLSRSGSVRENGSSRKSASVGANVFDRLAKNGGASGPRRGSGALETLNSPRAVSAARSTLTNANDDAAGSDKGRSDVKRGALTKIKDLVSPSSDFLSHILDSLQLLVTYYIKVLKRKTRTDRI
jgi:hypothetical protein